MVMVIKNIFAKIISENKRDFQNVSWIYLSQPSFFLICKAKLLYSYGNLKKIDIFQFTLNEITSIIISKWLKIKAKKIWNFLTNWIRITWILKFQRKQKKPSRLNLVHKSFHYSIYENKRQFICHLQQYIKVIVCSIESYNITFGINVFGFLAENEIINNILLTRNSQRNRMLIFAQNKFKHSCRFYYNQSQSESRKLYTCKMIHNFNRVALFHISININLATFVRSFLYFY